MLFILAIDPLQKMIEQAARFGFLKPVLIAKSGGKLPFLVMFLGVIGGLAAWGFTGMFKGAIIMAVFYTLFTSWLQKKRMSAI